MHPHHPLGQATGEQSPQAVRSDDCKKKLLYFRIILVIQEEKFCRNNANSLEVFQSK